METKRVATPDGVSLTAYAVGNSEGPEILFIHGFSQAALSWLRQMEDAALAREFRMVAYDMRGHGGSDKPLAPEYYTEDRRWADDTAAVVAAFGLKRPVLVGWSYAGRPVIDYVRHYGQEAVAGINFVAANAKGDPAFTGETYKLTQAMQSDDFVVALTATRDFVRACFEVQPAQEDFEMTLAFNMIVPWQVRKFMRMRTPNPGDLLPKLKVPVLVTHGVADRVSRKARSEYTAAQVPGARLSLYEGIGHAPFWEDAARFNRELAEFVRAAQTA
jgi:pimeloyl-ACP methyl ester carboxylesterase